MKINDINFHFILTFSFQATGRGKCWDDKEVKATTNYEKAELLKRPLQTLTTALSKLKDKLHEDYALYSYSTSVIKLQVRIFTTEPHVLSKTSLMLFTSQRQPVDAYFDFVLI